MKKPVIAIDDIEEGEEPMPFVMIRWCDAVSSPEGWKYQDQYVEWANGIEWLVETTGWILRETKEYIMLAGQRGCLKDNEYQYGMVMKIPKTWVKLRVDLTDKI